MQLKLITKYAIHLLLYLGSAGAGVVPAAECAAHIGTTPGYVGQVSRILRMQGWVRAEQGSGGGLLLVQSLEQITLLDVVRACEGTIKLMSCVENEETCYLDCGSTCRIRGRMRTLQGMMEDYLGGVPLSELSGEGQ